MLSFQQLNQVPQLIVLSQKRKRKKGFILDMSAPATPPYDH